MSKKLNFWKRKSRSSLSSLSITDTDTTPVALKDATVISTKSPSIDQQPLSPDVNTFELWSAAYPQTAESGTESRNTNRSASSNGYTSTVSDASHPQLPDVLYHSEVSEYTGKLLRSKRVSYMVLTPTALERYKSFSRASEYYSLHSPRPSSIAPVAQSSIVCKTDNVISLYKPSPTAVQIEYLDDEYVCRSLLVLLPSENDANAWLQVLIEVTHGTTGCFKCTPQEVESAYALLQRENDFDPHTFSMIRTVRFQVLKPKSSDDLSAYAPAQHYILVIGKYKIHLLSLKSSSDSSSSLPSVLSFSTAPHSISSELPYLPATELCFNVIASFGILALTDIYLSSSMTFFSLAFHPPFQSPKVLNLASLCACDVVRAVRAVDKYLRPHWTYSPLFLEVPQFELEHEPSLADVISPLSPAQLEQFLPPTEPLTGSSSSDHLTDQFARTLAANCAANEADVSVFSYEITSNLSDSVAPDSGYSFTLSPSYQQDHYSCLHLLALFRSLRFIKEITRVSFKGVPLNEMLCVPAELQSSPNANESVHSTVLTVELLGLVSTAPQIRSFDFSGCIASHIPTNSKKNYSMMVSELLSAVCQVLEHPVSRIEDLRFAGLVIDSESFEYLLEILRQSSFAKRSSTYNHAGPRQSNHPLMNLDVSDCSLNEREIAMILEQISLERSALLSLDLSSNPGRMNTDTLAVAIASMKNIVHLRLESLKWFNISGDPILVSSVLARCDSLETLSLDGTYLSRRDIEELCDALSYLPNLKTLSLQGCQLHAQELAMIISAADAVTPKLEEELDLLLGDNRLFDASNQFNEGFAFTDIFANLKYLRSLSLARTDFVSEDVFCAFLRSLCKNKTIKRLNLSYLMLPSDAAEETCLLIGELFKHNSTLCDLYLKGEHTKLQTARIGTHLNVALPNLSFNTSLEVLHIDGNHLGAQGAYTMGNVLAKNDTLRQLMIDENNIGLHGFETILNSLEKQRSPCTYVWFPFKDKELQLRPLLAAADRGASGQEPHNARASLPNMTQHSKSRLSHSDAKTSMNDANAAAQSYMIMKEKWEAAYKRMQRILSHVICEEQE
ncbi:hypothetical protein CANCADRAFT_1332 [Tortispora caseinolytica NRRL Y-17796]|uniref:PH domain-containing protein n=1 Tax=Tortispora caseinolytica NRRL Y-17796 TaxID=767744 RepID=A0A1E4TM62_9ASCO|nr:hypothetical protein CANCADRAFT_1332 [Tortispora caseinolytica NRRL Y-17796]